MSDSQQTQATRDLVLRHHLCWRHRDLEGVMSFYHPDIQYHDFFQNRVVGHAELREYLHASMPREADEAIEHTDRIRADGDTAFIQYRITLRGARAWCRFAPARPSPCATG